MRVAIFGASGLVGTAVAERLIGSPETDLRCIIHSDGNAWRLSRRQDVDLRQVDILDRKALAAAVDGCTHVVNCTRGPDAVMLAGLDNLLKACHAAGVARFVHLSSVAVYGDPPPPESAHEDAPTRPERGSYGWTKLKQDEMVARAAGAGLPAVVLCPPNITGPYSYFLLQLVDAIPSGAFALVDEALPCVVVDTANLAHAVERALTAGMPDGRRYFITDDDELTWPELIADLLPCAGVDDVFRISRSELAGLAGGSAAAGANPLRSLKHLVSDDVRAALRGDPLLAGIERVIRSGIDYLPDPAIDFLRMAVSGPIRVAKIGEAAACDPRLSGQQLRGVRHRCARAKAELGYAPVVDHARSMGSFRAWYRDMHSADTEWWPLLQELRSPV